MKASNKKSFLSILLVTSLLVKNIHAETPTTSTPEQATQQQQQQQPQQESDRKQGAGAAQAMAIAGAAMAGMSCIMMMNEARKMPPGSEKNMTMMMAMQQCSQAAQSAANAGQNDKAKKSVTDDIPKMAQASAGKAPTESKQPELPTLPTTEEKKEEEVAQNSEIPEPGGLITPKLDDPKVDTGLSSPEPGFTAKGVSISALKPIEASKVDFNEANKNDTPTITPPGMGGAGFFGGGKTLTADDLKKLNAGGEGQAITGNGKAARGEKGEAEAPLTMDGSSGSKEEGGGNSAFDQLLGQLMGGAPGGEALAVAGFGGDIVALPKEAKTGKGPNIFEFASYRYKVAAYEEGKVTSKKTVSSLALQK